MTIPDLLARGDFSQTHYVHSYGKAMIQKATTLTRPTKYPFSFLSSKINTWNQTIDVRIGSTLNHPNTWMLQNLIYFS